MFNLNVALGLGLGFHQAVVYGVLGLWCSYDVRRIYNYLKILALFPYAQKPYVFLHYYHCFSWVIAHRGPT